LLVENYQLTASVGLRVGWEFLEQNTTFHQVFGTRRDAVLGFGEEIVETCREPGWEGLDDTGA